MTTVTISDIVDKLCNDPFLIESRTRFADALDTPAGEQLQWETMYMTGAHSTTDHFIKLLQSWVLRLGENATLGRLREILFGCQFVSVAESLHNMGTDEAIIKYSQFAIIPLLPKIVKLLREDYYAVTMRTQFLLALGTPSQKIKGWEKQFSLGITTMYDYFLNVLQDWIERSGSGATLEGLKTILKECEFMSVLDSLEILYPEEKRLLAANQPESESSKQNTNEPQRDLNVVETIPSPNDDQAGPSTSQVSTFKADAINWEDLDVIGFLGAGSFGFVFKIQKNKIPTALKITVVAGESPNTNPDEVAKANRELQVMKMLPKHENVVELLHSEVLSPKGSLLKTYGDAVNLQEIDNHRHMANYLTALKLSILKHSIIMELELCGETLRQWLNSDEIFRRMKSGSPGFVEIQQKIAQGIISGLKHLHSNNPPIMHRDLKPENIYFSHGNAEFSTPVKIGDFGVSRQMSGMASETATLYAGTRCYRAPEVNYEKYSVQADLFSLGLIMWEIFEIVPFKKFENLQTRFDELVIDKRSTSLIKPIAQIPNLAETIFKLTYRDKTKRTKSIQDVDLPFCKDDEDSLLC